VNKYKRKVSDYYFIQWTTCLDGTVNEQLTTLKDVNKRVSDVLRGSGVIDYIRKGGCNA
jgi:hypothetical protein